MSEWKDLTIDNIKEFMVNEVEVRGIEGKDLTRYAKPTFIYNMLKDFNDYQFRLKPLKPIQITQQISYVLLKSVKNGIVEGQWVLDDLKTYMGRKVEIID